VKQLWVPSKYYKQGVEVEAEWNLIRPERVFAIAVYLFTTARNQTSKWYVKFGLFIAIFRLSQG
jgi:hypothetical protein